MLFRSDKLYKEALINLSNTCQPYNINAYILVQIAKFFFGQGEQWNNRKIDEYKLGYTKAYEICEQIETAYPNQMSEEVEILKQHILHKELNMQTQIAQLPGQPFLALLKFRNVETIYTTVYRLSEEEAIEYFFPHA